MVVVVVVVYVHGGGGGGGGVRPWWWWWWCTSMAVLVVPSMVVVVCRATEISERRLLNGLILLSTAPFSPRQDGCDLSFRAHATRVPCDVLYLVAIATTHSQPPIATTPHPTRVPCDALYLVAIRT